MSVQKRRIPEYVAYREEKCMMKPRTLTIIKGLLFSIIMGIVVSISLVEGTGQLTVIAFIAAVLLVFGVEVKEIEVGNWLTVTFSEFADEDNDDNDNDK